MHIHIHLTYICYRYICSQRCHEVFFFITATANIWGYWISSAVGKDWGSTSYSSLYSLKYLGKVMQQIHTSISSQEYGGCQQTCTFTLLNWASDWPSPNKTTFLHCGLQLQGKHQTSHTSLLICLQCWYCHSSWHCSTMLIKRNTHVLQFETRLSFSFLKKKPKQTKTPNQQWKLVK